MQITQIVRRINDYLAGENLSTDALKIHMDAVIDDINNKLNAKFPVFSEFTIPQYSNYPDYNFFPEKYIRSVVVVGAAYKFFVVDEEGSEVATKFEQMYNKNLFLMERDYVNQVPDLYRADSQGYIESLQPTTYAPLSYWD